MWIDLGKLIRESVPDKNGKTLPADLTSGSYEFRDLTNTGVGTLFEGKVIYDTTYGHVTYGCATCCGYNSTLVFYDPINLIFAGPPGSDGVWGYNVCEQGYDDVSTSFYGDWSSASTSIITVDYYANHSPQTIGSTTTSTNGNIEGTAHYPYCPVKYFSAGGGGNVSPSVTFWDTPLVPQGKPVSTTATVTPDSNTTPITLTISVTSGQGSATFSNGQTTTTITTTTSVTLIGVTPSSTPNNMQLTATAAGSTVGSMIFTVTGPINGAIPVNYRQTAFSVQPGAVLHFEYVWDSSSGNLADLSACQVEEYVTYVGPNPYVWASPPYLPNQFTTWPETYQTPVSATNGRPGLRDDHGHPAGWQTPYAYNSASSDQVYQFQCPYYQNNQWVQLMPIVGQIPITRLVNLTSGNLPWFYSITKYPYSTSMNLP